MKKLTLLRHYLMHTPALTLAEKQLHVYSHTGHIEFSPGNYRIGMDMPTKVLITDFSGDVEVLVYFIVRWMKRFEPDNTTNVTYKLDILNADTCDIELTLPLTQSLLPANTNGGIQLHYQDEPVDACIYSGTVELYIKELKIGEWQTDAPSVDSQNLNTQHALPDEHNQGIAP